MTHPSAASAACDVSKRRLGNLRISQLFIASAAGRQSARDIGAAAGAPTISKSQMQFTGAIAGLRPDPPESTSVIYVRMAFCVACVFGPAESPLLHGALCALVAPTFLHDLGQGVRDRLLRRHPALAEHARFAAAQKAAGPRLFVPRTQARYIHHVPIRLLAAILVPAINSTVSP